MIPLAEPVLGEPEAELLQACIDSGFVSSVGPFVGQFEAQFGDVVGTGQGVACSSGTAALHLALTASGVGAGDEVWASDLTFVATVNPIVYCGATPVLVDSEAETGNLDPGLVVDELARRRRAGERLPRAIIAVHLLGHPADLAPILDAAGEEVLVIEDAAESLGARWQSGPLAGTSTGAASAVGCFSFNGNKTITTGGGGMVVARDPAIVERARHLSTQARIAGTDYEHDAVGFNYRMTNVAAALGVAQLGRLGRLVARKRAIAARYRDAFRDLATVDGPVEADWAESSAWLSTIALSSEAQRDALRTCLREHDVDSRPIWKPVHRQRPFQGVPMLGSGAIGDDLASRWLSLPSSGSLTDEDQETVIDIVRTSVA